jgi:outer membrane lipoprotein-sorting protein
MKVELMIAAFLCSPPAAARGREAPPDADAVLLSALSAPATGYAATGRIQSFAPEAKPKALGLREYYLPDGRFRREILRGPGKPAELVYVSDGSRRSLYWPKLATMWTGTPPKESPEQSAARLKSLYEVSITTGGRVAKHATWRLNFTAPGGRLRRALWADRSTGMMLKCEEYRLDGTLARRERFTTIEPASPDPGLFRLEPPPGTPEAALTAPRGAGEGARYPRWIPDGFLALALRTEDRSAVVEYGDGVASFTIRETPGGPAEAVGRPVRLEDGTPARLSDGADSPVLSFAAGGRRYSVSGGITEDEMARVADSLLDAGP